MKQEVTLTKQEVNQAILAYAEKHGVRLDGMDATVEVMATRGDRELFATIALEPKNIKDGSKQEKVVEEGKVTPLNKSLPKVENEIYTEEFLPEQEDEGVYVEATQEIDDEDEIFG